MPQGRPVHGEIYLHFKKKLYQVLELAEDADDGTLLVIYQALYGEYRIFARPLANFTEEVDHVKYPEVNQMYRFQLVDRTSLDTVRKDLCRDNKTKEPVKDPETVKNTEAVKNIQPSGTEKRTSAMDESMVGFVGADIEREKQYKKAVDEENRKRDADGVNADLLRFLDAETFAEKLKIFEEMKGEIDDTMLDNLAASIDVVVPEGPMEKMIAHLRFAIEKRLQYENTRLRR